MFKSHAKKFSLSIISFLFLTVSVFAQQKSPAEPKKFNQPGQQNKQRAGKKVPYSDEEIKKFANVIRQLKTLRKKNRAKMKKEVEKSKLNSKNYQQMRASKKKNGQLPKKTSKEDKVAFNELSKKIKEIQQNYKKQMDSTLNENNMSKEKFKKMSRSMRKNKAMQRKVKNMI